MSFGDRRAPIEIGRLKIVNEETKMFLSHNNKEGRWKKDKNEEEEEDNEHID